MIRCVAFLLAFIWGGQMAFAEQGMESGAFVWNNEGFRVPIYASADLCESNIFGCAYLLNGCAVNVVAHQTETHSICVSFLDGTYWVDEKHITRVPPVSSLTISYGIIQDVPIGDQTETVIPKGTTVDIVGYSRQDVFVYWEGEYRAASPAAFEMVKISYDSPDYLVSKAEAISICLQHLQETYNITDDHAQTMRTEFLHYFTFGAPALYLIHFYTEEGEIYSYHFDGEYGAILYSSYAPYGVG